MGKSKGIVKFFDSNKGFGFIIPDDLSETEEKDVMIHYSDIISEDSYKKVDQDDIVEYICVKGDKGFQAKEVKKIE